MLYKCPINVNTRVQYLADFPCSQFSRYPEIGFYNCESLVLFVQHSYVINCIFFDARYPDGVLQILRHRRTTYLIVIVMRFNISKSQCIP